MFNNHLWSFTLSHENKNFVVLYKSSQFSSRVIQDNIVLISRALRHQFVIPEWHEFTQHIEEFYWSVKTLTGGKVGIVVMLLCML